MRRSCARGGLLAMTAASQLQRLKASIAAGELPMSFKSKSDEELLELLARKGQGAKERAEPQPAAAAGPSAPASKGKGKGKAAASICQHVQGHV